jgi:4-hydroxy-2-oxoheptanedioate aldolase
MRTSKTLARICAGEVIRTCNLGHYIPGFVANAARSGFDCIWLDLEHRAITTREVQALLAFGHLYDIDIMVRPPTREATGMYRFLEDGAAGLLVPFVDTAEEAQRLVQAVKFPPVGNRGLDGVGFDADFGAHPINQYVEWARQQTFLAVQIETPEALANVDAIAAVEGVDLVFVGPGDLGLRLSQQGGATLDDAWDQVAAACKRHGKAFGGPAFAVDEAERRRAQGALMLVMAGEFRSWKNALAEKADAFKHL